MFVSVSRRARPLIAGMSWVLLLLVAVPDARAESPPVRVYGSEQPLCPSPTITFPAPAPGTPSAIPGQQAPAPEAARAPGLEAAQAPTLTPEQTAAAGGGETFAAVSSAVGYIDPALPLTCFRLRVDASYFNNRPDRAEFFYAKCGCFKIAGLDPNAPGPPLSETRVDYQDIRSYLEYAFDPRLSAFVELPVRFLNPEINANAAGYADMDAGVKYAVQYSDSQITTLQLRTYIPTGDAFKGLGTNHVSIEPAVLVYRQLLDRVAFEGELRDWIPVGGTDFQGNILRYGTGFSYQAYERGDVRIAPVAEFVGWTVFNGKEFLFPEGVIKEAGGDTIINAKFGVRSGIGRLADTNIRNRAEVYVGYGRALTGTVWYKDTMRFEFRLNF